MKSFQLQTIGLLLISEIIFGSGIINPEKSLKASRVVEEIKIDGILSEGSWYEAEKASNFIQNEPLVGMPATFDTETYILYDNNAIYIGARMYDSNPEKILKELSLRDQIGNADNFRVFLIRIIVV
ncbi:MAG: hypothetical protein IPO92_10945 [Saprospiraceae bacterium]|nr:hypothetical protein [Saprospiraceae bacterium]